MPSTPPHESNGNSPKNPSPGKALVIGNDNRSFLTTVRSLGRAGWEVHSAWTPDNLAANRSRYLNRKHAVPAYDPRDPAWIGALKAVLSAQKFDLIIPCSDESIIPLQLHRNDFEPYARITLLPDAVFETFHHKEQTGQLARSLSIPTPREVLVTNEHELEEGLEAFSFPIVLKPASSHNKCDPDNRRRVLKAYTPKEASQLGRQSLSEGPLLIQEHFIGQGTGVEVLAKDGKILTAFQHLRLHEPLHGGGSSYRKSIPLHPGMLAATTALVKAVSYTGVGMFEYKHNPTTDEWMLIEVNARLWGSVALPVAAGIDFPRFLAEMLIHQRSDFPQDYPADIYCRNWVADLDWFRANLRANKEDPTLHTRRLPEIAREIVPILQLREYADTLSLDDPLPGLAELGQVIQRWLQTAFLRITQSLHHRRTTP
ncbi:ATP-grasp domain-containing protein [Ectothiorhodospira marina]|uniref:Predicted ATP-dependent carboligase, ATP-grasp superfamily n=1 Tax=Ectothiorhodospira marina TaxID=1396821 RepID=A0A1H7I9L9_9GAMM|nr:ATP-grasp domain-containing protein [Ectothiorhodospira marina]SEK59128.1 Predicted ATP-dependent carboligase, ATP-grasp superfamily [Ectothiorhodospira marina]